MIDVFIKLCNKIWKQETTSWTQSLIITLPRKVTYSLYHSFIDFKKAFDRVYGMQPYGPPCGKTISMQILVAPLSTCTTMLLD